MTTKTSQQTPPTARWINQDGTPSLAFFQYMKAIDILLAGLANGSVIGPLTNAANDAAAAAAGVPIGGLYRATNAVQIRLV
jgi:hypothetical protein